MTTAILNSSRALPRLLLPLDFEISLSWSWRDWSWRSFGYCGENTDFGTTALVLGPLVVHFEWSTL